MPRPTDAEVTKTQNRRLFIQFGGPFPGNVPQFAGLDAQYMVLDGVTRPLRTIEPIRVYNPRKVEAYKNVGRKISAPDFPTATLRVLENRGTLPVQLGALDCPFNLYLLVGKCEDLSDFTGGWQTIVEIASWVEATQVDEGARMAWEDDTQVEDAIAVTLESKYAIGSLSFSAEAGDAVSREVIDVVYGGGVQCGDCGPNDNGAQRIYAVTKSSGAASPGLPAEVIYSLDGGVIWAQALIDNFGATEDPVAVDIVGNKLVVVGADAYFWAVLSEAGVPGTFTKVSSGFVAAGSPLDLYVLDTNNVFFCGEGGYIYKATDITAGVTAIDPGIATTETLFRIAGDGNNTVVAAGASSAVVVSNNRGATFGAVVTEPSAIPLDIYALAVKDSRTFLVGTAASGRMFYTRDGGLTDWEVINFTGTGAGAVRDIVFATDEVGWMVHDNNTPTGYLWATWDGGNTWVRNDQGTARITNWPVLDRINRVAVPNGSQFISANYVIAGGLAGDGTDGVLVLGAPNIK